MNRVAIFMLVLVLGVSLGAFALTGTGDSGSGPLETVAPTVLSATAATTASISVTFSEPMLAAGVTNPANCTLTGTGTGTLAQHPTSIAGTGPYTLTWSAGEMRDGQSVTVTVAGVQDAVGNPLSPMANSAVCLGKGVDPVFSSLVASPAQAAADDTVTFTFTASEPLTGEPELTVNGYAATFVGGVGNAYTFRYVVADTDTLGMASIAVSGFDLAGNLGVLTSGAALEIVKKDAGLPVYTWPAVLAFLLAIILFAHRFGKSPFEGGLPRRSSPAKAGAAKRRGMLLLLLTFFVGVSAFAAPPAVSNVTFTQSPNGTTATQADIYYDLTAPNGSCTITVSLSKDGGADGFIHPVTSVTGDIAGVTTGTGKHIVWDIAADYPNETIANAAIRVLADDAIVQHTLTYTADTNGTLSGTAPISPQVVSNGGSGTAVTAEADTGYHFVQWSDGSTDNPRTDANVTADISVTATFAINTYAITCNVTGNGTCTAVPATVNHGSTSVITVTPDPGWHVVSVVDGVDGPQAGSYTTTAVTAARTVTATFAINSYAITCNVVGSGTCTAVPATVNHGSTSAITVTADPGWHIVSVVDSVEGPQAGSYTTTAVTAARTITATFAINTYAITCDVIGNGTCTAVPATVNHGSTSAITVTPDPGWHIVSVVDSVEGPQAGSYTTTAVTAARTVTATFAINSYAITCNVTGNGSCTAVPATVNHGSTSAITVTPDPGWHIVSVVDSVEGAQAGSYTTTAVTAARTVTATFAINQYTLTYTAGANGSITGVSPQTVNHGASGTLVTAVAGGGYAFSQWSDGVMTATRTDTNVMANLSVTATFIPPPPVVTSFAINSGAATTMPLGVTLNNTATNSPVDYMASESASFTGAVWMAYGVAPAFTLSFGVGTRTVYFKARNGAGESGVVSDTIFLTPQTVSVAAGAFNMGRLASGTNDDRTYGGTTEDPVHSVTLAAYTLGKCEVTNKEYCDVLNWALAQGYLYSDAAGTPWAGTGSIYAGGAGFRFLIVSFASTDCNIQYSGGVFSSKTRVGLPGTTNYSMDTHPMVRVSWYGSVAFCNWLSQWQGVASCYNMGAANWPLTVAPPTTGGYRLPTEAEWERAAAWDGTKHWIYGFLSDTNATGTRNRCNDYNSADTFDNPLGLTAYPYTSPVGWFNGTNVSPNGTVTTVNSPSPVGAYDMTGNVWEWCGDWYLGTYYTSGGPPWNNPTGPASGASRVYRGGGWYNGFGSCRSAYRNSSTPAGTSSFIGFRLSRS